MNTATATATVSYGVFSAQAKCYGHFERSEWRINLKSNELGVGTLRAGTLEGLATEFRYFIDEAMADQAAAAAEAYPDEFPEDYYDDIL